jgi:hypothetical protein
LLEFTFHEPLCVETSVKELLGFSARMKKNLS